MDMSKTSTIPFDDYKEIVGFLVNGTIYSGAEALRIVKQLQHYDRIIRRTEARFMVSCDLGHN